MATQVWEEPKYSCQENPHGQRSLAGYSPRGRKESDTTEVTWLERISWEHLGCSVNWWW